VQSWCDRDKWNDAPVIEKIESSLEARLVQLIAKDQKTGGDFKEIDLLTRQVVQMARVRRYEQPGGNEVDLNPKLANRNAEPKKKPSRNDYSEEQRDQLLESFRDSLFDYQKVWLRNGHQRTRVILKSRQIGATWYFAREALADAMETGRNQIFLSASKRRRTSLSNTSFSLQKRLQALSWPVTLLFCRMGRTYIFWNECTNSAGLSRQFLF
jgi:uncharacterized protein YjcR